MHMRTTLDLPQELVERAMLLSGAESKTQVIKDSLELMVRQHLYRQLKEYRGKLNLKINLNQTRQRSR